MTATMPRRAALRTAVLLGFACSVAALPAAAELPAAVRACMSEQDDAVRLACYDRELQRQAAVDARSFGLSGQQKQKLERPAGGPEAAPIKAAPVAVSGVVAGLRAQADGRTVITLADGAVWIQGEAFEPISLRAGDTVTVKPGLLGSFYLYPPSGSPTRVRRLR